MALPEHIAAQMEALDPAGRAVVLLIWHIHEEQSAQLAQLREMLAEKEAVLAKYQRLLFGSRSEKMPPISSEVRRVIEEEELTISASDTDPAPPVDRTKARRTKGRAASKDAREKRKKDLSKLPVVHEEVCVSPDALPAGTKPEDFRRLGDGDIVRRIEHVREHLVVVEYKLEKLVEKSGDRIVQASAPNNVIDGGLWGASVYAHVVVAKCLDSMPLYRISKALGRGSFAIARSVLCDLFHRTAEVLSPIYERLVAMVCVAAYLHADETRLRVAEPKNARDAWVWALVGADIVAYVFSETRGGETASRLIGDTQGHLIVDGYAGYNASIRAEGRTRVGCWAHARRYFWEALKTAPEKAQWALDRIIALYRIEHAIADREALGTEVHTLARSTKSRAIVEELSRWVDEQRPITRPKSPLGKALGYFHRQRKTLEAFLADPKVPLDNNVAERALRVVAIGRKNFLFVGHDEGGRNLAILQTICHTCVLHGINPYEYIKDVAVRVRTHPNDRLDELLPGNWPKLLAAS